MEQLQAGRPATGTPGQRGRGLRRERGVVDRAEQLLHLPGTEPKILTVELGQLARDQQPGGVDLGRAPAAQHDPDLARA
jgi:hypothetical protein